MQRFPKAFTFVRQHLHEAVETPIIVDQAIPEFPLAPFFGGLVFLFRDHHLPLGKVPYHDSAFSHSGGDQMRGFMMTILLFASFLL